jgi:hypothetical protein
MKYWEGLRIGVWQVVVGLVLNAGALYAQGFVVTHPAVGDTVFSNEMVIKGTAPVGAAITVRGITVQADSDGNWSLPIKAPSAPGVYTFQAQMLAIGPGSTSVPEAAPTNPVTLTRQFIRANPGVQNPISPSPLQAPAAGEPGTTPPAVPAQAKAMSTTESNIPTSTAPLNNIRVVSFLPHGQGFSVPKLQEWNQVQVRSILAASNQTLTIVPLDSLESGNTRVSAVDCHSFECALKLGAQNAIEYMLIGKVDRRGLDYVLQTRVLSLQMGGTIEELELQIGPNLRLMQEVQEKSGKLATEIILNHEQKLHENGAQKMGVQSFKTVLSYGPLPDTLYEKDSPYLIEGSIIVPANQTTVIQKGVQLLFKPGEYGTLNVFGILQVNGTEEQPVHIRSAAKVPSPWDWNRITFLGSGRSVMDWVVVEHANYGVHVENSGLVLNNVVLKNNSLKALYVRNGDLQLFNTQIQGGQTVGLHASYFSDVQVERSVITGNRNGILVEDLSQVSLTNSQVLNNDRGIVLMDSVGLMTRNVRIEQNQVGISSTRRLDMDLFKGVRRNRQNFLQVRKALLETALKTPDMSYFDRSQVSARPRGDDFAQKTGDESVKEFSSYGSVQLGGEYHYVETSANSKPINQIVGEDTIGPGKLFPNIFETPGWRYNSNAYLAMEWGENNLEFSADASGSQEWVHFWADPVYLNFYNPNHRITIGDFSESGGELSFSGTEITGGSYKFMTTANQNGRPVFGVGALFGESVRPYAVGDKDEVIYEQRILEGSAIPQEVLRGAKLEVNPTPQLQLLLGVIDADRRTNNMILGREDLPENTITSEPILEARSYFAEGAWWGSNLELKVQGAFGYADTLNLQFQKAMDLAWNEAELFAPAQADVYDLLLSEANIRNADSLTLAEAAGVEDRLSRAQLIDTLLTLRSRTRQIEDSLNAAPAQDRTAGMGWSANNFAGQLDLYYALPTASITAKAQYIGMQYYSAGAAYLLQNSRAYSLIWDHKPTDAYSYALSYDATVENAANVTNGENSANYLGFGEGSSLGLGHDPDYQERNALYPYRPVYTHNAAITNRMQVLQNVEVELGYMYKYQFQNRSDILSKSTDANDAVYTDPWFAAQENQEDTVFYLNNDSVAVSQDRWIQYLLAGNEDTLASGMERREHTHELKTSAKWRIGKSSVKLGATLKWMQDKSEFTNNAAVKSWKLADTTWYKLGYYPDGNSYFQHSYPLSVNIAIGKSINNNTTAGVRFKQYVRDEMEEFEWNAGNRLQMYFWNRKLQATISGDVRQQTSNYLSDYDYLQNLDSDQRALYYRYTDEGVIVDATPRATSEMVIPGEEYPNPWALIMEKKRQKEVQTDLSLSGTLRINISSAMYSEIFGSALQYIGGFDESSEYKDVAGGITFYYSF